MRVNIYAEEMTDRVVIVEKTIDGQKYHGLRIYLYLPVTQDQKQIRGPFIHKLGDDDSSAVTFWGKADLRDVLDKARDMLDEYYRNRNAGLNEEPQTETRSRGSVGSAARQALRDLHPGADF